MSLTPNSKQLQVETLLRAMDGKEAVPQGVIDEIMGMLNDAPSENEKQNTGATEEALKLKMAEEPDWRKRASLAAMIISKSLE